MKMVLILFIILTFKVIAGEVCLEGVPKGITEVNYIGYSLKNGELKVEPMHPEGEGTYCKENQEVEEYFIKVSGSEISYIFSQGALEEEPFITIYFPQNNYELNKSILEDAFKKRYLFSLYPQEETRIIYDSKNKIKVENPNGNQVVFYIFSPAKRERKQNFIILTKDEEGKKSYHINYDKQEDSDNYQIELEEIKDLK